MMNPSRDRGVDDSLLRNGNRSCSQNRIVRSPAAVRRRRASLGTISTAKKAPALANPFQLLRRHLEKFDCVSEAVGKQAQRLQNQNKAALAAAANGNGFHGRGAGVAHAVSSPGTGLGLGPAPDASVQSVCPPSPSPSPLGLAGASTAEVEAGAAAAAAVTAVPTATAAAAPPPQHASPAAPTTSEFRPKRRRSSLAEGLRWLRRGSLNAAGESTVSAEPRATAAEAPSKLPMPRRRSSLSLLRRQRRTSLPEGRGMYDGRWRGAESDIQGGDGNAQGQRRRAVTSGGQGGCFGWLGSLFGRSRATSRGETGNTEGPASHYVVVLQEAPAPPPLPPAASMGPSKLMLGVV